MTASAQRLRFLPGRLGGVSGGPCITAMLSCGMALLGVACGSAPPSEHEIAYARSMRPSVEMATNPTEELALERAAALPDGEPTRLADGIVVAAPIYPAASGRRCREMIIGPRHRLACEDHQAEVWVFVPDVFSAEPGPTSGGAAPAPESAAETPVTVPPTPAEERDATAGDSEGSE